MPTLPIALTRQATKLHISLPDLPALGSQFDAARDGTAIKQWLEAVNAAIDAKMCALGQVAVGSAWELIKLRTLAVDALLCAIYALYDFPDDFALLAIGGYGRAELLPASDVDILLIGDELSRATAAVENFVANLWDIGIAPAVSVRSCADTKLAVTDQTIATALLEARLLAGNAAMVDFVYDAAKGAWTTDTYFNAKIDEAQSRYLDQNTTEYNLEPNIKEAPGGLRDIHILGWLGRFHFGKPLEALQDSPFINQDEYKRLHAARSFLWCIRHHLHTITGRSEDRLLFDHQKSVARRFGYLHTADEPNHHEVTAALETMMRTYYQHAMHSSLLSEMLCVYFKENYLAPAITTTQIDADFYLIQEVAQPIDSKLAAEAADEGLAHDVRIAQGKLNKPTTKIAITRPTVFHDNPANLLRIFLVMGQYGVKRIAAATLRQILAASQLIDENYRENPAHQQLFLANLQERNYLFHRLRLMKRFGVLGNYLPAFGQVMGLMQYDLFHRYTVDAHTLLLIRILHRFGHDKYDKYGLVSEVYQKIARKDILSIAAIFHDIAKGRGGDHSQLGAVDAYEFCISHGMSERDADLVRWLVAEHLTMSMTAQKQDISDPEVIGQFAEFTGNITRLNHLYVLTVADMNATNSQLWNNWRATLLKQLYTSTHRALSLGMDILDKKTVIANRKDKAQALLGHTDGEALSKLWDELGDDYFIKQKHTDIAWLTENLLTHADTITAGQPLITLRAHTDLSLGGIQLLLCTPDQDNLFAITVTVLDQLGLSVLDASILTSHVHGMPVALDSYVLIDRLANTNGGQGILENPTRQRLLIERLTAAIKDGRVGAAPRTFEIGAKLKHFTVPTQVQFMSATNSAYQGCHQLSLVTKDRPALLAKLGQVFGELGISVHGARITTLGERAEDMFYISDHDSQALNEERLSLLKTAIIDALG